MRPQWTEWFNVCLMMLNISFWSKLITTILLVWRPDWIWQYKVKTMFLFDSQGITFTALSYIEVLGYSSWIRNKKFWTYRAMSQFWVSSQPPPSDISVPWIICDKQWTAKKKKNSTSYSMNYIIMSCGSVLSFFVYFSVSLSYMYINIP